MTEPAVEESADPDEGETASPESPGDETAEGGDEDVEMVQTDIETTGADPDGFFDGVDAEASGGDDVDDSFFDGVDDDGSSSTTPDTSGGGSSRSKSTRLADDINAGVARAAVIGLDDKWETEDGGEKKKTDLQEEFEETFEAFRLGHYASICAEEYLMMEAEDIHPVWGLIGASLICSAVIVYKRPDGDQVIDTAKTKLGDSDLGSIKEKLTEEDDDEDDS